MFYSNYCKGSKIHMPVYKPLVRFGGGGKSTEFMCLIWSYSSMFDHSSLGVKVDDSKTWFVVLMCFGHAINRSSLKQACRTDYLFSNLKKKVSDRRTKN
jgi:hypothetical protein